MRGPIPWDLFAQGEYLGPHRTPHVPEYRLRVNDQLEFVYRLTRERSARPYQLNVGDRVRLESLADDKLDRDLEIQPDGSITVRLLGQMNAAGLTTDELRVELEKAYKKFYRVPSITVTPLTVNTRLEDIRATVDSRQGWGVSRERRRSLRKARSSCRRSARPSARADAGRDSAWKSTPATPESWMVWA